jgi:hypothetical protein
MARQVAQWVSDFDFCCLVVQLRHASLIALLLRASAVTGCQKNSTEDLSSIAAPKSLAKKEGLAFELASINPSDPFMGHMGICVCDLID